MSSDLGAMSDSIIQVENLSKRYVIGHQRAKDDGLRHVLEAAVRNPLQWLRARTRAASKEREEFWALKDVSFDVKRGEVVGIIGRNGAGKSTLLKILSRITQPTSGRIHIKGRVASLLEVGTGFHPELTGRENVFLNGAILGMKRAEIGEKFDEIVAFADVEQFLDTPVKRYSSGMYVRLAFAVAAHLEPEILVVDEVLAVGDAEFQKKCLGKMKDVSTKEGRTVLYVSHNLTSIRDLCHSAVLLKRGAIEMIGDCQQVIALYMGQHSPSETLAVPRPSPEILHRAYVTNASIEMPDGRAALTFPIGQPWQCRVHLTAVTPQKALVVGIGIVSAYGTAIQTAWSEARSVDAGEHEITFEQDRVILEAGCYSILIGLDQEGKTLQQFEAARIEFASVNKPGTGTYQRTSGVGVVINSMKVHWKPLGNAEELRPVCPK